MKITIRKSKHQVEDMTDNQFAFAVECVRRYKNAGNSTYYNYSGSIANEKIGCDVYKTKTAINAIVYKG